MFLKSVVRIHFSTNKKGFRKCRVGSKKVVREHLGGVSFKACNLIPKNVGLKMQQSQFCVFKKTIPLLFQVLKIYSQVFGFILGILFTHA